MKHWANYLPNDCVTFLSRDEVLTLSTTPCWNASAALFESLIRNHPFIDGNKRLVFFATDVFLRLNGYKLQVDANKAHRFLIRLLENLNCTFEELLPWIRGNVIEVL